ncbi:MAG: heme-binding protein [Bacteriovorax sp.]|nr:heme-binding protein [Bacteriovorax sp.]
MSHNSHSQFEVPLNEKVKSLPGFFGIHLEKQAPYDVLKTESGIEVRCYRPQTQARVTASGEYKDAQKEAFNVLAEYIFGENKKNEKIQMTTPVLLKEISKTKEWTMTFILPPHFSISSAPKPNDKRISLHELPVHLVASISYPGINTPEKIAEYTEVLKKWLKKRPWYIPLGDLQSAQFDGPLTIPFFRKNEIHIEVKHLH